jgi:hypothetical protein
MKVIAFSMSEFDFWGSISFKMECACSFRNDDQLQNIAGTPTIKLVNTLNFPSNHPLFKSRARPVGFYFNLGKSWRPHGQAADGSFHVPQAWGFVLLSHLSPHCNGREACLSRSSEHMKDRFHFSVNTSDCRCCPDHWVGRACRNCSF